MIGTKLGSEADAARNEVCSISSSTVVDFREEYKRLSRESILQAIKIAASGACGGTCFDEAVFLAVSFLLLTLLNSGGYSTVSLVVCSSEPSEESVCGKEKEPEVIEDCGVSVASRCCNPPSIHRKICICAR